MGLAFSALYILQDAVQQDTCRAGARHDPDWVHLPAAEDQDGRCENAHGDPVDAAQVSGELLRTIEGQNQQEIPAEVIIATTAGRSPDRIPCTIDSPLYR